MDKTVLVDGTGEEYRAKVDGENRLRVRGIMQRRVVTVSEESGMSIFAGLSYLPVGTNEILGIRISNDDDRNFHVDRIITSWNGGDINKNRTLISKNYIHTPPAARNFIPVYPPSTNITKNISHKVRMDLWDGNGEGIETIESREVPTKFGVPASSLITAQGTYDLLLDGLTVMGPGSIFALTFMGEEPGRFSVIVGGWIEENE